MQSEFESLTVSAIVRLLLREETTAEEAAVLDEVDLRHCMLDCNRSSNDNFPRAWSIRVLPSAMTRR
jgi:hypothetical protein